jgi:integrase
LISLKNKAAYKINKRSCYTACYTTTDWSNNVKITSEYLVPRGKSGIFYIRRRIPTAILSAYPKGKAEIVRSLRTSDRAEATKRFRLEQVRIDAEFAAQSLSLKERDKALKLSHVKSLTDEQIRNLANYWSYRVLLRDAEVRQNGMDEDEFDERGESLSQQRQELGKLLARGHVKPILPAMLGFMHLCGLDAELSTEEAQKAGYVFLESVVKTLDYQLSRQAGNAVNTGIVAPEVPHPADLGSASSVTAGWDEVFRSWQEYVADRPRSTVIGYQTPWGQLKRFAADRNINCPAELTPKHIAEFVSQMGQTLEVKTISGRLSKLKEIFKIAVGKELLKHNPAEKTLGFKESKKKKGEKRRLPFSPDEISTLFGSPVFTQHLRSSGQSGEASYWIPLLMFYTGARPEELAGLELSDIQHCEQLGWRFVITDLTDADDCVFDIDSTGKEDLREKRLLKNNASRRQIPVAKELIELGFLRYAEWVRGQSSMYLFPTLSKDFHGKLGGAFSKWFGRYKTELGFTSPKKVLYSLRHNMKDFMEAAEIPPKPLKRILGHASGDGTITDGYGSDIPFEVIHAHFSKIRFPLIPALPWQPGKGYWRKAKDHSGSQ